MVCILAVSMNGVRLSSSEPAPNVCRGKGEDGGEHQRRCHEFYALLYRSVHDEIVRHFLGYVIRDRKAAAKEYGIHPCAGSAIKIVKVA